MEKLSITNQTLKEFIDAPFGNPNKMKNLKYEDRYQSFKRANKIRVESSIELDENYFVHLKVPSESQKGLSEYDVVVQFCPHNEHNKVELTVENYYVQFFSNSPGFVYKYASLYKLQGYLIESLAGKFVDGTLDILPDKTNRDYELYFDSSIYYACRYLLDNKLVTLGKLNLKVFKTKRPDTFFRDVQDVESMEINRSIVNLETSVRKEIQKDTKLTQQQENRLKKKDVFAKQIIAKKNAKKATKSTMKDTGGITSSIRRVLPKGKKASKRSTRKI